MTSRTELTGLLAAILCACGGSGAEAPASVLTPLPKLAPIPPPLAPGEGPMRTEKIGAIVLHLSGSAEVQRGGAGEWTGLKIGDAIRQGDAVRTTEDGLAELTIGDAQLKLANRTTMAFSILGARRVRAEVSGSAEASRGGDGDAEIELASARGDAVARLRQGRLALVADGRRVSVAAVSGSAELTARGATQAIKEGQVSMTSAAGAPGKPVTAPRKISLKVRWPAESVTNRAVFPVRGNVSATARVWIQGQPVELKPNGDFTSPVSLKKGKQKVTVVALDILGRKASDSRQLTFDPDAPSIRGEVRYK